MSNLNDAANKISKKYIRKSTNTNYRDNRKKRGLQAEINKIKAIQNVILSNNIDERELHRLNVTVNELSSVLSETIVGKYPQVITKIEDK